MRVCLEAYVASGLERHISRHFIALLKRLIKIVSLHDCEKTLIVLYAFLSVCNTYNSSIIDVSILRTWLNNVLG